MKKLLLLCVLAVNFALCSNNRCYDALEQSAMQLLKQFYGQLNTLQAFKLGVCYADAKHDYCFNGNGNISGALNEVNQCISNFVFN